MKLSDAEVIVKAALDLTGRATTRAAEKTQGGAKIDDHQALSSRVAYAATEARAATELCELTAALGDRGSEHLTRLATAGAAELVTSARP
jgi:alkylation response protein AidB-like acyl-CoA dehydrogenase